jgi:Arm DNA-binding domain
MSDRLTDGFIRSLTLPPGKHDKIWWDDLTPGFGYRIRQSEKWNGNGVSDKINHNWIFQYRRSKQTRRLVIGQASAVRASQARAIASELHAKVKLGFDPATEKLTRIERARHTFGVIADKYLEHQRSQLRPGSYVATERGLKKQAAALHGTY